MIFSSVLTINRSCNFRCPWCYAASTGYAESDNMEFKLAIDLIDFSKELGVKSIALIGGEPAYYPQIFELIEYIESQNIQTVLVTNGSRFKDVNFARAIDNFKNVIVNFSLKGASEKQYYESTNIDAYSDIIKAMKNLKNVRNIKVGYSTVVSKETLYNMVEYARLVSKLDNNKSLKYSFCNGIVHADGHIDSSAMLNPKDAVVEITKNFDTINELMNGNVYIEQTFPKCIWPEDFLKKAKRQLIYSCRAYAKSSLIFDKDGRLLICNSLPDYPVGQYMRDFKNKEEFEKFWNNEKLNLMYKKFCAYPSPQCKNCKDYLECGGGCNIKWFSYDPKDLLKPVLQNK